MHAPEPQLPEVSSDPNSPPKSLDRDVDCVIPQELVPEPGAVSLCLSVDAPLSLLLLLGVRIPSIPSLISRPQRAIGRLRPVRAASPVRRKKARVSSASEAAIGVNGSALAASSPGPTAPKR